MASKFEALTAFIDVLNNTRIGLAKVHAALEESWGPGGGQDALALLEATNAVLATIREQLLAEARKRGIR